MNRLSSQSSAYPRIRSSIEALAPGRYVVGVSGGVDSTVLLHAMHSMPGVEAVVAHVDHGIRDDSAADARFVEAMAGLYGMEFRQSSPRLGKMASEQSGRQHRYDFFRTLSSEHNAAAIVTAHHEGDALETIVLNLRRGSGWRGLVSLRSTDGIRRPLLGLRKSDIYAHALAHRLEWCEDETNGHDNYERNRIRHQIVPRLSEDSLSRLLELRQQQLELRAEIAEARSSVYASVVDKGGIDTEKYRLLPESVRIEILRSYLANNSLRQTRPQLRRVDTFIRTAESGKLFSITTGNYMARNRDRTVVKKHI